MASLLACVVISSVTGCSDADKKASPKEIVQKFCGLMLKCEFDNAKKYCDEKGQKKLTMMSEKLKKLKAENKLTPKMQADIEQDMKEEFDLTIQSEQINGDDAVVNVIYSGKGETDVVQLKMKKVDGMWVLTGF